MEYPSGWTCEVTVVRLERYVVESLPRREMLAVGEHLEACVECAQLNDVLRVVAFAGSLRRGSFNRALLEAARQLALGRMTISPIEIGELARTPGGGCARAIRCGAPADARRHSPRPLGVARSVCALDRPGAGR